MKNSTYFEQKIKRIHQMLEPDGSIIKWNDKIIDPDNPKKTRQIDISIRNGEKITHLECRIHSKKQDVKWIEELHGRKISLNIKKIIAVSSSGFTKGALFKAKRFNIKTYSLEEIPEASIEKMKPERIGVRMKFYEFISFRVYVYFDWLNKKSVEQVDIKNIFEQKGIINTILNIMNEHLDKMFVESTTFMYNQTINNSDETWSINNIIIDRIEIRAIIKTFNKEFKVEVVEQYNCESIIKTKKEAILEANQGFEVIKKNKSVSITFNPSKMHIPLNCLSGNKPIIGLGNIFTVEALNFIDSAALICIPVLEFHPFYIHKQPLFFQIHFFK